MVVVVGTDARDSARDVELAGRYDGLFAAVGIGHQSAPDATDADWAEIERLAAAERVVAIGETGLDLHWTRDTIRAQEDLFARHLDLARRAGLPAIVHSRSAEPRALEMVRSAAGVRAVFHCYTGPVAVAEEAVAAGHAVGFTGVVTYENAEDVRAVALAVGPGPVVVETDCPYMVPDSLRRRQVKHSEPAHVRATAEALARLWGLSIADVERTTTAAACDLFGVGRPGP